MALLDLAQDVALRALADDGLFDDLLTFKGGTALRKLVAGQQGRFSTDIDLAVDVEERDRQAVADLVAETIGAVECDRFRFAPSKHRGRWSIQVSAFGLAGLPDRTLPQTIKLDVGPPTWLAPQRRDYVRSAAHRVYQFDLPSLPMVSVEEMAAEKLSRLSRRATARDAFDLRWLAQTPPWSAQLDRAALRRLTVLKAWVDFRGLNGHWTPVADPLVFDPVRLLATGRAWDEEQIGELASPPPTIEELEADFVLLYAAIGQLDEQEQVWQVCDQADRSSVVEEVARLSGGRFDQQDLWQQWES